ncbi:MAG: LemA family protein [Calditerrivibrio sp.]|nr:LemA family protein [Calditerrivibrio sp.]
MGVLGIVVLIFIVVIVGLGVFYYNRFVSLRNMIDEAYSSIDVQLKRRYDLIPNLVETVKGYAKHEQMTLENVVRLRNIAQTSKGIHDKIKSENMLTSALRSVFALAESYPDLKANENFLSLQSALVEIENNIQAARRYYNAVVKENNTLCETFPSLIIAKIFHFGKREYFTLEDRERGNVEVSF